MVSVAIQLSKDRGAKVARTGSWRDLTDQWHLRRIGFRPDVVTLGVVRSGFRMRLDILAPLTVRSFARQRRVNSVSLRRCSWRPDASGRPWTTWGTTHQPPVTVFVDRSRRRTHGRARGWVDGRWRCTYLHSRVLSYDVACHPREATRGRRRCVNAAHPPRASRASGALLRGGDSRDASSKLIAILGASAERTDRRTGVALRGFASRCVLNRRRRESARDTTHLRTIRPRTNHHIARFMRGSLPRASTRCAIANSRHATSRRKRSFSQRAPAHSLTTPDGGHYGSESPLQMCQRHRSAIAQVTDVLPLTVAFVRCSFAVDTSIDVR